MKKGLNRLILAACAAASVSAAHGQARRPPDVAPMPPLGAPTRTAAFTPLAMTPIGEAARPSELSVGVQLADIGFAAGFRLANLGGRREIYIPAPQGANLVPSQLALVFDDISAHEARRSLEVLVNDRSAAAIALDGASSARVVNIPLKDVAPRDGFLKLSFVYSGAATQDRCIDVRYVGDSLTVRPETALEFSIGASGAPAIAATAALMPQNVVILLTNPRTPPEDMAAALTIARSLSAAGRRVAFRHGADALPEIALQDEPNKWTRGVVAVGAFDYVARHFDTTVLTLARASFAEPADDSIAAARIGGIPVLLVASAASARAGRLLGGPSLAALRDSPTAAIAQPGAAATLRDRVTFDQIGLAPSQAEVFGRAELAIAIPTRSLPNGQRPSRLLLDVMVAPDGAGEKAVVSAFVNERLMSSAVAAIGGPTHLDIALPDGLVGAVANIRVVVQRRSAQGDCRFEPQGYPVEVLGSSALVLSGGGGAAKDFHDLSSAWSGGVEVLLPAASAARPLTVASLVGKVLASLSPESAPVAVRYVDSRALPAPKGPFLAVGNLPPDGASQRVRLDRGRIAVADRAGRTRLDIAGLAGGAVAQIATSGGHSGLWIAPLADDGALPAPPAVNLDRGDVAFMDRSGVALALSTERDTLLAIAYPDQQSWMASLQRLRPWIVGSLWIAVTLALLLVLQRVYRRRAAAGRKD